MVAGGGGVVAVLGAEVEGGIVVAAAPDGAVADTGTTNQDPATPCPLVSPGLLSSLKRYSGMPRNVTCNEPSDRLTVPSADEGTPVPAMTCVVGEVSGGHAVAHPPVQVGWPVPSGANR